MTSISNSIEFEERAAILEFDHHLPRAAAEAQAAAELGIILPGRAPGGVLGELIAASRLRDDSRVAPVLADLGLAGRRAPAWGVAHVVIEGTTYRPAGEGEGGRAAVVAPAGDEGLITDLVAQPLPSGRAVTRLGIAAVVGADEAEAARDAGEPLNVFNNIISWLRGDCRGVVVLDWRRAVGTLEGITTLQCSPSIADTAYRATRRSWPVPQILVPDQVRHAA
jgi:hypothetical protein